ncbi:hypothetical protein FACS189491_00720 [Spirochaetia bacterium]|nr:hypothetical protein FACS189491_00720 [Spirochaetia bacterium]
MDTLIKADKAYIEFILNVKQRIQAAQIKASVAVNHGLMELYWDIGASIVEKQKQTAWGDGFLQQMSIDLQHEFPDIQGFSHRNLKYIRQWYIYWSVETIGQQLVAQLGQIPWGHNLVIISKIKNQQEALFYVQKTIENNWSRAVLTHQIEGKLFQRTGKAINNFEAMLPKPQSDLARETLKDPYKFDSLRGVHTPSQTTLREQHTPLTAGLLIFLCSGKSTTSGNLKLPWWIRLPVFSWNWAPGFHFWGISIK